MHEEEDPALAQLRLQSERRHACDETSEALRKQRALLHSLRRENKELRHSLQIAAKGGDVVAGAFTAKEVRLLETKMFRLRRQLDTLRFENAVSKKDVEALQQQQLHELPLSACDAFSPSSLAVNATHATPGNVNGAVHTGGNVGGTAMAAPLAVLNVANTAPQGHPALTPGGSSVASKLRWLESRLDKSLIRHNEALSIRRTYQRILARLEAERVGFDNQLAAIEKTLKQKEVDLSELKEMSREATSARDAAKAQLEEYKQQVATTQRKKQKELTERHTYVNAKMEQVQRQERAQKHSRKVAEEMMMNAAQKERDEDAAAAMGTFQTEEEQRRLRQHAENIRKLKELTHASTKSSILQRFLEQHETNEDLQRQRAAMTLELERLICRRSELRQLLEVEKYNAAAPIGSRRVLDEFESHLEESRQALAQATKVLEARSTLLTSVRAGVEHLAERLSLYRPEIHPPAIRDSIEEDTTVEVLRHCEAKMLMLMDELQPLWKSASETASPSMQAFRFIETGETSEGGGEKVEPHIDAAAAAAAAISAQGPNALALEPPPNNVRITVRKEAEGPEEADEYAVYRVGVVPGEAEARRPAVDRLAATLGGSLEGGDAEDDPHSREELKQMATGAVEREIKKARKKGRMKDEL